MKKLLAILIITLMIFSGFILLIPKENSAEKSFILTSPYHYLNIPNATSIYGASRNWPYFYSFGYGGSQYDAYSVNGNPSFGTTTSSDVSDQPTLGQTGYQISIPTNATIIDIKITTLMEIYTYPVAGKGNITLNWCYPNGNWSIINESPNQTIAQGNYEIPYGFKWYNYDITSARNWNATIINSNELSCYVKVWSYYNHASYVSLACVDYLGFNITWQYPSSTLAKTYRVRLPIANEAIVDTLTHQGPIATPYHIQSDSYAIKRWGWPWSKCHFDIPHTGYLITWGFQTADWWNETVPSYNFNNISIDDVHIVLYTSSMPTHSGYFSFCTDYPNDNLTHLYLPQEFGNWTNSSIYPYYKGWFSGEGIGVIWDWNVTTLHPWTIAELTSNYSFRVMWSFTNNATISDFDYLGISYTYHWLNNTIPIQNEPYHFTINVSAIIWLLMTFLPAIIMGQAIPKIGFFVGLVLMLIVMGFTIGGFLPITVIGIIGVAIVVYKGD